MASATDTSRGKVFLFEEFLYDAVADRPEYSLSTAIAASPEIVATGQNGFVRMIMVGGTSDVGGMGFGQTQWYIPNADGEGVLTLEMRVRLSAVGTAAERVFIGFTDRQQAVPTEFPFTIATTTITAVSDPDDAIGFIWEGDASNASWYPASQNNDSLVIDGTTNVAALLRTPPVATEWQTLKMVIHDGAKVVEFFVDEKLLYRYSGAQAIDDVALIPTFMVTEGTTAINFDVDYVYVEANRIA